MIQFRDYQVDIIKKAHKILNEAGFVYLSMEVRTGKTLTSLGTLDLMCEQGIVHHKEEGNWKYS